MWGIILALISGALMSIQGVFNTEVTKRNKPVGIHRLCPVNSIFRVRYCVALYRT